MRFIWITLTVVSAAAASGVSVSAASPLRIATQPSPPDQVELKLGDHFAPSGASYFGSIEVQLADHTSGDVDIYPLGASPEDRISKSCRLTAASSKVTLPQGSYPSASCQELFGQLGAEELELAISKPGSSVFAIIHVRPLEVFQGGEAAIDVPPNAKKAPDWASVKIPPHVSIQDQRCYLVLDRPVQAQCDATNRKIVIGANAQAVILARWARKETVWLVANVLDAESSTGAWRKLALRAKPPEKTPVVVNDDPPPLEQRCVQSITFPARADTYYVCVDLTRSEQGIVTLACGADAKSCRFVGDVVHVGRGFLVRVWHGGDALERVSLGGVPGTASMVHDGLDGMKKIKAQGVKDGGRVARKVWVWSFGPRKPGAAPLVVTAKQAGGDVARFEHTYTVEAIYRFAVRLGLGFGWRPWARTVGIQASADGQRFAAILEGDDTGLTQTELVTGVTYLFHDVRQDSLDVALGIGVRLGLLGIGEGFKSFTSLSLGPEVAIGPDFAIGVYAGFARHDAPNAGYEPGALIPNAIATIPTHTVATPTFTLVLNFTPGFLSSIGVVR